MRRLLLAFLIAFATSTKAHAQDALVLSGGGARGLAHAGVIAELEERGQHPGIIVGTSMGAVIGALYAAGFTADEIISAIRSVEWSSVFEPTPLAIGVDHSLRYPMFAIDLSVARFRFSRGLVGQWQINRMLAHLLFDANARTRGDFDRLVRRFRPIVADLQTGEAFAIARGDLALAVRASMSVPGFFAPIEWGDRILIDGGIAANLPTGFAKELGASYITAVDVVRVPPEVRSTPLEVVERAIQLMIANTQKDAPAPDILILPKIPHNQSSAAFPDDPTRLIEIGRAAAREKLRPLLAHGPRRPLPPAPQRLTALRVEAPDSGLAAFTRAQFDDVLDSPFESGAITHIVDRLYATGLYQGIWPRVTEDDTLVVRVSGHPRASVHAAVAYESDRGGRAWASLDHNTAFAGSPATLSLATTVGSLEQSASITARLFGHITRAGWSMSAYAVRHEVRTFAEALTTSAVVRGGGWMGVELPHLLHGRFAVAAVHAEHIDVEQGESGWSIGPLVAYTSTDAPNRVVGVPFSATAEHRFGDISYSRLQLSGSARKRIDRLRVAAIADLRAVTTDAPLDVQPALGDDHMIPGLRWGELRGPVRAVVGLDAAYPIGAGFLRTRLRTGAVTDDAGDLLDSDNIVSGAQLGVYFATPLGALDVSFGSATRGKGRFYVSLGQRF